MPKEVKERNEIDLKSTIERYEKQIELLEVDISLVRSKLSKRLLERALEGRKLKIVELNKDIGRITKKKRSK